MPMNPSLSRALPPSTLNDASRVMAHAAWMNAAAPQRGAVRPSFVQQQAHTERRGDAEGDRVGETVELDSERAPPGIVAKPARKSSVEGVGDDGRGHEESGERGPGAPFAPAIAATPHKSDE